MEIPVVLKKSGVAMTSVASSPPPSVVGGFSAVKRSSLGVVVVPNGRPDEKEAAATPGCCRILSTMRSRVARARVSSHRWMLKSMDATAIRSRSIPES
jgi:hypothetical protein